MPTHIQIACPSCQHTLKVRREYAGRKVACNRCAYSFRLPAPDATESPPPVSRDAGANAGTFDEAELQRLCRELETTRAEVETLRAEGENLRARSDDLGRRAESLEVERDRLRTDLESAHSAISARQADLERLDEIEGERDRLLADRASSLDDLGRARAEVENLRSERDRRARGLDDAVARHESERARWQEERQALHDDWERQRRDLADESSRLLVAERDRHGEEVRSLHGQVAALEQHRAEAERRLAETAGERDRLDAEGRDGRVRLDVSEHALEQERDARRRERDEHVRERDERVEELEALRRERDVAVLEAREVGDRLTTLRTEVEEARLEAERSRQVEHARLTEECDQLRRQAEADRARVEDLAEQLFTPRAERDRHLLEPEDERSAHDRALDAFNAERDAFNGPEMAGDVDDVEHPLADVRAGFCQDEPTRPRLDDALTAARRQIETLTLELQEARLEQKRVRSVLDGLGIHLR